MWLRFGTSGSSGGACDDFDLGVGVVGGEDGRVGQAEEAGVAELVADGQGPVVDEHGHAASGER